MEVINKKVMWNQWKGRGVNKNLKVGETDYGK